MEFNKERFEYLLRYLEALMELKRVDYKAFDEIKEVIAELKAMLNIGK